MKKFFDEKNKVEYSYNEEDVIYKTENDTIYKGIESKYQEPVAIRKKKGIEKTSILEKYSKINHKNLIKYLYIHTEKNKECSYTYVVW
jgi:hypothetical protein